MEKLRREAGETVLLIVLERDSLIVVERLEGTGTARAHLSVGAELPLHASASGKTILSTLPERDLKRLLRRSPEAFTSTTTSDPDDLRRELQATARRGYALYSGEWLPGLSSVGVPICVTDEGARAALVVVGAAASMPGARRHDLGKALLAAKKQVEAALGP
jgi:DNA-binding IclR family transcriptional regulator